MAKSGSPPAALFAEPVIQRRRVLILPRLLDEEADRTKHRDDEERLKVARAVIAKWADMEKEGRLRKKETALNANFLNDIFGNALGYRAVDSAEEGKYTLERELYVPGVGPVDGALGFFPMEREAPKPAAVIELKDADKDLDTDKSNGRTAVAQLFDYLNALPETKWGIVSNFSTIRLYHKDRGNQTFEIFSLQKLRNDPKHFDAFWCLLERGGLLPSPLVKVPRAEKLLLKTEGSSRQSINRFYDYYTRFRARLMDHLRDNHCMASTEGALVCDTIVERTVFVALASSLGILPPDALSRCVYQVPVFSRTINPRWQNFLDLFEALRRGHDNLHRDEGFNHELFAFDISVDELQLDDGWAIGLGEFGELDYENGVAFKFVLAFFKRASNATENVLPNYNQGRHAA